MNYIQSTLLRNRFFLLPSSLRLFHALSLGYKIPFGALEAGEPVFSSVRTNIRNNFPKPRERKRIKVHSWWARLKTTAGKKTIMKRILKGKHCLAHGW